MVNDYFKGAEMSVVSADRFTLKNLEPDTIREDKLLMDKKFWDYKMLHPAVATMYFISRYIDIAAQILEREVSAAEARSFRYAMSRIDLRTESVAIVRAWTKARMAADAIGCTYDVYIRAVIKNYRENFRAFTTKNLKGHRRELPLPSQLVSTFAVERAILEWTTYKAARLPFPEHSDIPNNPELWFRPEMEAWLIEEAMRSQFSKSRIQEARDRGLLLNQDNPSNTVTNPTQE
jgi:hypothetical protein